MRTCPSSRLVGSRRTGLPAVRVTSNTVVELRLDFADLIALLELLLRVKAFVSLRRRDRMQPDVEPARGFQLGYY